MTKNAKIGLIVATAVTLLNAGCLLTSFVFWMASGSHSKAVPMTLEEQQAFRAEIENIVPSMRKLNADTLAKQKDKTALQRMADQHIVLGKYVEGLYAIDISKCPMDFQEAYLEFLRSFENAKNFYEVHGGVADALGLLSDGLWGAIGNAGKLTKEEQSVIKDINEKTAHLRLVAKKYNAKGF